MWVSVWDSVYKPVHMNIFKHIFWHTVTLSEADEYMNIYKYIQVAAPCGGDREFGCMHENSV